MNPVSGWMDNALTHDAEGCRTRNEPAARAGRMDGATSSIIVKQLSYYVQPYNRLYI